MAEQQTYYIVYRTGRTYGVFAQPAKDGTGQELVEGGFFNRRFAEAVAQQLNEKARS